MSLQVFDANGAKLDTPVAGSSTATYAYSVAAVTPVATPTAVIVLQGSASKTVRVKRIAISGVATAAGNMPVVLTRRSTAGTLGSAVLTAITAAQHDKNQSAPTAVVSTVGTANYTTLGTTAGQLAAGRVCLSASGSGVFVAPMAFEFGTRGDMPPILRGTSDYITVDFSGAAVPSGGVLDVQIQTEEDNS